jgi:uncharacterized protein YecE (DUF72 family)
MRDCRQIRHVDGMFRCMPRGAVRIGISGWNYPKWRGEFYPRGLVQRRELEYASRTFDSIEVNGSFYSLLRPDSVRRWHDETPNDFVFAVKGSRFITHMKRLRDVEIALANFCASGLLAFGEKLGPILWQLPPSFSFDAARLGAFFEQLPRTTRAAARLARRHDERVEGRSLVSTAVDIPLRHALEVRHPSFHDSAFLALLKEHRIAVCIADTASRYPQFDAVTADFAYVRLHGATKLYESGYSRRELELWAGRIDRWRGETSTGDVFVYFDNDAKVHAPFDARTLMAMVHASAPSARGAHRGSHEPRRARRTNRAIAP